jgi:hypothetical protein
MPSVIRGSDNFDTAGGNAVKAWVNFDGTGTPAIRAAYNVASITDNGAGQYEVNLTTAMPDVNYAVVGTASINASSFGYTGTGVVNTGKAFVSIFSPPNFTDMNNVYVAVFR